MAIVFLQTPPKIAAAFNEIPLVVQTPKARYDQLTKDLENATTEEERANIQREMDSLSEVRNQTTLDPMTFVAMVGEDPQMFRKVIIAPEPGPDGTARIDLSYIMRRAFIDKTEGYIRSTQIDYNIVVQGYINENYNGTLFSAVNAVYQSGYYDSSQGLDFLAKVTNTPLIYYPGYPLIVTIQLPHHAGTSASCSLEYDGSEIERNMLPNPIGNIVISEETNVVTRIKIVHTFTGEVFYDFPVSEGCVPDAPFYIRWINTMGGWDSWMFERREETDDVEDVSSIQLHAANPTDTQTTVSLSASRTVTVGEGLLSKDEYRALAALPRSPRIKWYNEELQAWQTIVVAEGFSATWNSRNGFGDVEFTFALPRILTQF